MSGHILLNIAHHHQNPKAEAAAFRLLGFFESPEKAQQHAALHWQASDVNVHLLPLKKWTPIMKNAACPPEEAWAHLESLWKVLRQRDQEHLEEFLENKNLQRTGKVSRPLLASSPTLSSSETSEHVLPVPRASEVRGQNFAIISILDDFGEEDKLQRQPAFIVWGVYETEEKAREVAVEELGKTVRDVNLDVVVMYEWLTPAFLNKDEVVEKFRNDDLTALVEHRKKAKLEVEAFRQQCSENAQEVPCIDLGSPRTCQDFVENNVCDKVCEKVCERAEQVLQITEDGSWRASSQT